MESPTHFCSLECLQTARTGKPTDSVTAVSFLCPQGQSDGAKAPGVAKANALSFKQVREAEVESRGLGMDAEGLQKTIKGLLRSLPHMIAPVLFLSLLLESDLSLIKTCFLFSPVFA